ncbi:hypothetical protein M409DRAFT_23447 [Zasmidium cellare ATCC 36951]|uniref:Uncharacterized protein n=1 Tax=Zasmidium cellare ATCC 36951 TaxID=1080233 RepID=A0A6A6CGG4_ZASCE|nr:uncharacterized protein M409DRAFT_23447 [Zasmidium cellare ATCC 36951]KAF2166255.1 hypothetical protein M409DRAFT_23447 [Zasmidium cellare ATCC 36951]
MNPLITLASITLSLASLIAAEGNNVGFYPQTNCGGGATKMEVQYDDTCYKSPLTAAAFNSYDLKAQCNFYADLECSVPCKVSEDGATTCLNVDCGGGVGFESLSCSEGTSPI